METKTTSQEYIQKQKQAKDIYGNKNKKPRIYMETKTTSQEYIYIYIQKQKQAKDIIIWKQKQQVNDIIYMERKKKKKTLSLHCLQQHYSHQD